MTDVHDLAAAYALNALDDVDRARFERHLPGCEACRASVAAAGEAAALLTEPVEPPASMREAVLAAIESEPQETRARAGWRRNWGAVAAAALLIVIGFVAITGTDESPKDRILAQPDGQLLFVSGDGVDGELAWSASAAAAVFEPTTLPDLPPDSTFQLWLIDEAGPRPAGLFSDLDPVEITDVARGQIVGLTIEPAGGSDQPTGDILLAVGLGS